MSDRAIIVVLCFVVAFQSLAMFFMYRRFSRRLRGASTAYLHARKVKQ